MEFVEPEAYIAEMNRRLRAKPAYNEGMRFEAFPPGATGADIIGITWVPLCAGVMTVVAVEMAAYYAFKR